MSLVLPRKVLATTKAIDARAFMWGAAFGVPAPSAAMFHSVSISKDFVGYYFQTLPTTGDMAAGFIASV